ncbi:MAG: TM0106 family RecB-like putative nuclease [Ramlibacter sp.]|nr:TM0106 family RecB-like putative nuclease [Ramlibacter sp.]
MAKRISGGMLYNIVQCPHRVFLDATADPALRDEPNDFVQLLWDHGLAHELEIAQDLGAQIEDLSQLSGDDKAAATLQAMEAGADLIYSGRIEVDDLVGEPDLLRKIPGGYEPGDIKSGSGLEGVSDDEPGKPKLHYAMQLAHYAQILELTGRGAQQRKGFIIDRTGTDVPYDLSIGLWGREKATSWDRYQAFLADIRSMLTLQQKTLAALASVCGMCHWHSHCSKELEGSDDLTLIPELGRAKRDAIFGSIKTVKQFATADLGQYIKGKKTEFPGIGPDTLIKFQQRAKLLATPGATAYLKESHDLPETDLEVFFDVETDPMRGLCYLHGFYLHTKSSRQAEYRSFFMQQNSSDAERSAFADAWNLLAWAAAEGSVYVYSPYERTAMRSLAQLYPEVVAEDAVVEVFSKPNVIDLYTSVVRKKTEWPLRNHSIKTLAKHLGFNWRDAHPSGAASIEWYHRWIETGDKAVATRILEYNEDDCVATKVLLDGIRKLPVVQP